MVQYVAGVTATSNSTLNTQDVFLEIGGCTGASVKVKRVRVGIGSGTQVAGFDNNFLVQFFRYTTASAGSPTALTLEGATYNTTPGNISTVNAATGNIFEPRNFNNPTTVPAGLVVNAKAATTGLILGSGTIQLLDQISPNGRALYEWLARDDDDMWQTKPAGYFAVCIASAVASQVFTVTVDFVI